MEISEATERLEYLKAKAQVALEQEIPEWVAEDILGTIEAYDMAIEALRKTENSSEKPNNCEHITEDGVTCAKYPACDDCLDNPLNKVKGSERLLKGKDEPTISKMEQVEDEPLTCSFSDCDNFKNPDYARCIECKRKQIELKTEPNSSEIPTGSTTEDCSVVEERSSE